MTSRFASSTGFSFLRFTRPVSYPRHVRTVTLRGSHHNPLALSNLRRYLPRIFSPELWQQILPQRLRTVSSEVIQDAKTRRSINPASYFIWIYILIGSQAIRILRVKNDTMDFSRRANLQIDKLREVVRRLQDGERVDVEAMLGTGVESEEVAWEEALQEIENEERDWQDKKRRKREDEEARAKESTDASPVNDALKAEGVVVPPRAPGFY